MKVIKRDGRKVDFDKEKIKQAVLNAFNEVDGEETTYAKDKARDIANYVSIIENDIDVDDIQKIVEDKLMASNRKDVAREYIIYRNDRDRVRQQKSKLMKNIAEKLTASNVQNQNANVDERSFGGRMGEATEAVTKDYALNYLVSDMARNNHINNEIYIHDLGSYAIGNHNCLTIPFDDLLANGFNTRQTDVRAAQSVRTAFQLVAVIFQIQSLQQFGGVSASHIDWTMVPYVRKSFYKHWHDGMRYIENHGIYTEHCRPIEKISIDDAYYRKNEYPKAYKYALDMTEKEIYQSVEGLLHNLNTLQSRSGNQLNTMWLAA